MSEIHKGKEYLICGDCSIVIEDLRTGMSAVFNLKDMIRDDSGLVPQLRGKDLRGLGYLATITVHEKESGE